MAWPAVKLPLKQEAFRDYVSGLAWTGWRPGQGGPAFVWHNTFLPRLSMWMATAEKDEERGLVPGTTRINNLEHHFWKLKKWSGAPHLFIAPDYIWVFNPLTASGIHSPSWNNTAFGLELIADFDIEDDDSGLGLRVKRNAVFATAVLCEALGIQPTRQTIKLHREDPDTTHKGCPGLNLAQDVDDMVREVQGLMAGGEHDQNETGVATGEIEEAPELALESFGTVTVNGLNFRNAAGMHGDIVGELNRGVRVAILKEARNGNTAWLNVRSPAGYIGWVAGIYVKGD